MTTPPWVRKAKFKKWKPKKATDFLSKMETVKVLGKTIRGLYPLEAQCLSSQAFLEKVHIKNRSQISGGGLDFPIDLEPVSRRDLHATLVYTTIRGTKAVMQIGTDTGLGLDPSGRGLEVWKFHQLVSQFLISQDHVYVLIVKSSNDGKFRRLLAKSTPLPDLEEAIQQLS